MILTKKFTKLASILILFSGSIITPSYAEHKPVILPNAKTVQDIHNRSIEIPSTSGKWVILSYWAHWCGPCRREIPELNAFYKNNQDKVVLVGINTDLPDIITLHKLAKELKIQFPLLQSDPLNMIDNIEAMPTTYLISPSAKVYGPLVGPQSEASLLKFIKKENS